MSRPELHTVVGKDWLTWKTQSSSWTDPPATPRNLTLTGCEGSNGSDCGAEHLKVSLLIRVGLEDDVTQINMVSNLAFPYNRYAQFQLNNQISNIIFL